MLPDTQGTDLQGTDTLMFDRNDGLTEAQKRIAQEWTCFDEDLDGTDPAIAAQVLRHRTNFAHNDLPRYAFKRDIPDDVVLYRDIPYMDGGPSAKGAGREHLLDVLLPRDAVVRGGAPIPVILEIHGGAFFYGFKEINRAHAIVLAQHGYAVASVSYSLYPAVDFLAQLRELAEATRWIREEGSRYLLDADQAFITADSAGAVQGLHLLAAMNNEDYADLIDVHPAKLGVLALGFKSTMLDLDRLFDPDARDAGGLVEELAPFFARYADTVRGSGFERLDDVLRAAGMPPTWTATSTDDFLEATSLELGARLRDLDVDHQVLDYRAGSRECLPHNFIVGMPWLEESRDAVDSMIGFFTDHLTPRTGLIASE